jgi:hypothetical protein
MANAGLISFSAKQLKDKKHTPKTLQEEKYLIIISAFDVFVLAENECTEITVCEYLPRKATVI